MVDQWEPWSNMKVTPLLSLVPGLVGCSKWLHVPIHESLPYTPGLETEKPELTGGAEGFSYSYKPGSDIGELIMTTSVADPNKIRISCRNCSVRIISNSSVYNEAAYGKAELSGQWPIAEGDQILIGIGTTEDDTVAEFIWQVWQIALN